MPRLAVVVVLPTPPLPEVTVMTRPLRTGTVGVGAGRVEGLPAGAVPFWYAGPVSLCGVVITPVPFGVLR